MCGSPVGCSWVTNKLNPLCDCCRVAGEIYYMSMFIGFKKKNIYAPRLWSYRLDTSSSSSRRWGKLYYDMFTSFFLDLVYWAKACSVRNAANAKWQVKLFERFYSVRFSIWFATYKTTPHTHAVTPRCSALSPWLGALRWREQMALLVRLVYMIWLKWLSWMLLRLPLQSRHKKK